MLNQKQVEYIDLNTYAWLSPNFLGSAVISAVAGYAMGMSLAQTASFFSQRGTTAILLPWPLTLALFGITVGMCVLASIVSINKVTRLDPAIVFKG